MTMIIRIACTLWLMIFQVEVPFKPNDEFQLELDYKFKVRPTNNHSVVEFEGSQGGFDKKKNAGGPLPYLNVKLKILKTAATEVRIKGNNNKGLNMLNKKVEAGNIFSMDLGFTDDMKDQVTANEFYFYFLDEDKKEVSRIFMIIKQDGTFVVNDEVRGKF